MNFSETLQQNPRSLETGEPVLKGSAKGIIFKDISINRQSEKEF